MSPINSTRSAGQRDNLTARDPDLNLIPRLATEWKATSDTTWEFKLRPGVKFHNIAPVNGRALDMQDIIFSYERFADQAQIVQKFRKLTCAVMAQDRQDALIDVVLRLDELPDSRTMIDLLRFS